MSKVLRPVYPGHAAMIALQIMEHYPSLQDALSQGASSPKPLEDTRVCGAGGAVYAALDLLKSAESHGVDGVFARAQDAWVRARLSGDHKNRLLEGLEQAEKYRDEFHRRLAAWIA